MLMQIVFEIGFVFLFSHMQIYMESRWARPMNEVIQAGKARFIFYIHVMETSSSHTFSAIFLQTHSLLETSRQPQPLCHSYGLKRFFFFFARSFKAERKIKIESEFPNWYEY